MKYILFYGAALITVVSVFLVARIPYFPGDRAGARFIQSFVSGKDLWVEWIAQLATFPWYFLLLLSACLSAWMLQGVQGIALSLLSFIELWLLDKALRLILFQPRPSPDLIYVKKIMAGSAFPSSSALMYMATFGFLGIVALKTPGYSILKNMILLLSASMLTLTLIARVAVGAHWPSDILLSYLVGIIVIRGTLLFFSF
jgi:membrane-associated phospholipid phosphatase